MAVTGRRLNELLALRPAYRRQWQRHAVQVRSMEVHQAAVARVLARQLLRSGRAPGVDEALAARRLKDLVARALGGVVLSRSTLTLFVEAFGMTASDAEELSALLDPRARGDSAPARAGDPAPPSWTGSGSGEEAAGRTEATASVVDDAAGPWVTDRYRTVTLHEVHTLGPDGRSLLHRTVHVIRAVHVLTGYPYVLDSGGVRLEVLRGGRSGPAYRVGRRLAVDIEFHRPLRPGETGSFEYLCHFDPAALVTRRLRRGSRTRSENVELQVRFDPSRLPDRIWWAVWPDPFADRPLRQEPVELEPDGTVHRFVDAVERQAVGFRWRYPG